MSVEDLFARIYSNNGWGDPESRSGPGSSVFRTRLLRPALTRLCREFHIRSLLDLGCGDFNWMRLTDLEGIQYIGGDVVGEIIQRNTDAYADSSRHFVHIDMLRDAIPEVDLILCRDGLVHFSFADIEAAIRGIRASGSKYLLATTFQEHASNEDIATGGWRPLNLEKPPFLFPSPIRAVWDGPRLDGSYADKALALYRIEDLPK